MWWDSALFATNSTRLSPASLYSTIPFLPSASQLLCVYSWPLGITPSVASPSKEHYLVIENIRDHAAAIERFPPVLFVVVGKFYASEDSNHLPGNLNFMSPKSCSKGISHNNLIRKSLSILKIDPWDNLRCYSQRSYKYAMTFQEQSQKGHTFQEHIPKHILRAYLTASPT